MGDCFWVISLFIRKDEESRMNRELLAPAGSLLSLKAAIRAGADAVYIGGEKFGARAMADNPDMAGLIEGIEYAHLRGKQVYLTVNTLLKNEEIKKELYDYLLPFYEAGIDAFIVQDLGVFSFIKKNFPDIDLHASTQMAVTGVSSARLLKDMGASRIVTARELNLREIEEIHKAVDIEIESFVHGALCYCYSGECLFSSMLGGRSGNRGRCAQPCRMPYKVSKSGETISSKEGEYALSAKDINTLEILPAILRAGVYSLKIEGRMKKAEYTAGVVSIYRKYLDLYEVHQEKLKFDPKDLQMLYDIYNRDGFHTGYFEDYNGADMIARENQKKNKKKRNEEIFKGLKEKYLDWESLIPLSFYVSLKSKSPAAITAICGNVTVTIEKEEVTKAKSRPLDREQVEKKMGQLGGSDFYLENLELIMDEDIFLSMGQLNALRREAVEAIKEAILAPYRRKAPKRETENFLEAAKVGKGKRETIFVEVSTKEQFELALSYPWINGIYLDLGLFLDYLGKWNKENPLAYIHQCSQEGKECYISYPYMIRGQNKATDYFAFVKEWVEAGLSGFLVRNLDTYQKMKEMGVEELSVLDYNLYSMNDYAIAEYERLGCKRLTAPYELNAKELYKRQNKKSEVVVYGYIPLMISAQCVNKNFDRCNKKGEELYLTDRYQKKFLVKCICHSCYNIIYNSVPLTIWQEKESLCKMGFEDFRLSFTVENRKKTKQVLDSFYSGFIKMAEKEIVWDYTKGHFKRGIE